MMPEVPELHCRGIRGLIAISQEMKRAAGVGDWARVSELATRRDTLMRATFQDMADPGAHGATAEEILELHDTNKQLLALVQRERDRCGEELREHRRGKRATHTYRQASSL